MSRAALIVTAVACFFVVVSAILFTVLLGAGGAFVGWLNTSGTARRAAAASEIDGMLKVTVERAARAEGQASQPDARLVTFRLRFENASDRDISAFAGTILLMDELGWTVFDCAVDGGRPLGAHETATEERTIECLAHKPSSGTVDGVDVGKLTGAWLALSLTLADGTKIEVFPEQSGGGPSTAPFVSFVSFGASGHERHHPIELVDRAVPGTR